MSVDARLAEIVSRNAAQGRSSMVYFVAERLLRDGGLGAWCDSHLGPEDPGPHGAWRSERLTVRYQDLRYRLLVLTFGSDADAMLFHMRWHGHGDWSITRLGESWLADR